MVEFVSWIGVAVIALFAVVGFTGVVATSLVAVARRVRPGASQVEAAKPPHYASAA